MRLKIRDLELIGLEHRRPGQTPFSRCESSALFLERAQKFAYKPPGPDWKPVNTLEGN